MKLFISFFICLLCFENLSASQFKVDGKVYDKVSGNTLSFANIRVAGSMAGSSANAEGAYQVNLDAGKYKLIASYIGFRSDTLEVTVSEDITKVDFYLTPVEINLQEVVVLPGENPALKIIQKVIKRREERENKIQSYQFEAYTKGIIRSTGEAKGKSTTINIKAENNSDSADFPIRGILENHSKGFFKKPDHYKELITAQKQTSNFPSSVNTLTGGRLVQSFYNKDIQFFGLPMVGPISDDALDYYYFYLSDTLAMDDYRVFKIYFEPDYKSDPGFRGHVFIKDKTFDLMKVDVELNRAANFGGIFDTIRIFQQFLPYKDSIYMPIDYRLFLKANILGLVRIGLEINSIMYNYEINNEIEKNRFSKAILTVVPGADAKDSLYWNNSIRIPNTFEEVKAYKKIDSTESIPKTFWDRFSTGLLSGRTELSDHISVTAPLGVYHFNRVEGHALDFGIFAKEFFNKRFNSDIQAHYGFDDEKFKSEFNASYLLGNYRTYKLSFSAFNKLEALFPESEDYDQLFSTILSLFSKYEFKDYYYTKGFSAGIEGEVFPVLSLGLKFSNHTDNSAFNNTNYSFFRKDKKFRDNPPIFDTKINMLSFSFKFDFRDYIEDGYFRRRMSLGNSYLIMDGSVDYSDSKFLNSGINFTRYNLGFNGVLNTFKWSSLYYNIRGTYSDGPVPFQMQNALAGNIDILSQSGSFRTVEVNEYFGDKLISLCLEHDFGSELFRMLRIPVLKDSELQLTTYFNTGWLDISGKSKQTIPEQVNYKILRNPLYEAGFSIGHVIFPLRLEFTWRLNHTENNRFVFGLSLPLF